jgi:hypothetical protein
VMWAMRFMAGEKTSSGTASHNKVVGARGHQGGQCTGAAGSPGHPD